MTITTILTMLVIVTTVIGGFIYFVSLAMNKERTKDTSAD